MSVYTSSSLKKKKKVLTMFWGRWCPRIGLDVKKYDDMMPKGP